MNEGGGEWNFDRSVCEFVGCFTLCSSDADKLLVRFFSLKLISNTTFILYSLAYTGFQFLMP